MKFDGKAQCILYVEAGPEYLRASDLSVSANARTAHFAALTNQESAKTNFCVLFQCYGGVVLWRTYLYKQYNQETRQMLPRYLRTLSAEPCGSGSAGFYFETLYHPPSTFGAWHVLNMRWSNSSSAYTVPGRWG